MMIIDLRTVTEESECIISERLGKDWWTPQEVDESILGLDTPLEVRIRVYKTGNKFVISGALSGGLQVRCDRCLEHYHRDLTASFDVFLVQAASEDGEADVELLEGDMEVDFIHGEEIQLDEIIREQIFLSLPMKCVCKEDCLGLCTRCGANLNTGRCECKGPQGHPGFSKLRDLKLQ